jgi:peptidoglycan/xylan/chitin deacetylase (PgdA/CDA1 family)
MANPANTTGQGNATAAALLYHNVGAHRPGTYFGLSVTPRVFERQMAALARHGYTGISGSDWTHAQAGEPLPPKPVILTFDDGYRDLAQYAFPILEKHGFRATVFVVTDLIGRDDEWLRCDGKSPQALLTADEIRYWAARGIEFGAHSCSHADLTKLSPAALDHEVVGSRRALEALLGKPVRCFAYPYGFYNDEVVTAVRREFDVAFLVEPGRNRRETDPYLLRRTMVAPTDGAAGVLCRAAIGRYPIEVWRARIARARNRLLG